MGAAATGSVSVNTARKDGKRYTWGAERPGVIEKRVQSRKDQIDAEIAKIREEGEQWIARRVAAKEAEKKKLADQEVLVAEHRKALKERRRPFNLTNSYIVPKGTFTDEQRAAIKAKYPDIDDEEADFLLSKRARQGVEIPVPESVSPQETETAVSSGSKGPASVVEQRANPVETKAGPSEKPKPAAVQIEASVTFSAGTGEAERDWSDFDPEAWEEGQDYPEHLYRAVPDQERTLFLVPNTDMDEPVEPKVTPEIQALRDRRQEIVRVEDDLFDKFGRNRMLWTAEVIAEAGRLDKEATEIDIQLLKLLAAQ